MPAARRGGAPIPRPRQGSRARVLVVEDNVLNQVVAVGILTRLGYDADVVDNGRDAGEAVTRGAYGGVLMHRRLPSLATRRASDAVRWKGGATPRSRASARAS